MNLNDIKNLNPSEIPSAPLPMQLFILVLAAVVVLVIFFFVVVNGQWDSLKEAESQEQSLKETYIEKKKMAINKGELEKQLEEIKLSFGALLKQLPNKSEMESLLTEINQAGVGRGLQFELFRPGAEVNEGEMAVLPISIKLSGSYQELATFVSDVGQLSRIVTIGDISLTPLDKEATRLTMTATAKTYRALESDEKKETDVTSGGQEEKK